MFLKVAVVVFAVLYLTEAKPSWSRFSLRRQRLEDELIERLLAQKKEDCRCRDLEGNCIRPMPNGECPPPPPPGETPPPPPPPPPPTERRGGGCQCGNRGGRCVRPMPNGECPPAPPVGGSHPHGKSPPPPHGGSPPPPTTPPVPQRRDGCQCGNRGGRCVRPMPNGECPPAPPVGGSHPHGKSPPPPHGGSPPPPTTPPVPQRRDECQCRNRGGRCIRPMPNGECPPAPPVGGSHPHGKSPPPPHGGSPPPPTPPPNPARRELNKEIKAAIKDLEMLLRDEGK